MKEAIVGFKKVSQGVQSGNVAVGQERIVLHPEHVEELLKDGSFMLVFVPGGKTLKDKDTVDHGNLPPSKRVSLSKWVLFVNRKNDSLIFTQAAEGFLKLAPLIRPEGENEDHLARVRVAPPGKDPGLRPLTPGPTSAAPDKKRKKDQDFSRHGS